ncbi:MAG TPA: hypothetical protein VM324_16495 [Egibacteraceae bacterium]|jgi:hypothetical protein|nr:hypothetical protein [Egibacteraceae bacterium]
MLLLLWGRAAAARLDERVDAGAALLDDLDDPSIVGAGEFAQGRGAVAAERWRRLGDVDAAARGRTGGLASCAA